MTVRLGDDISADPVEEAVEIDVEAVLENDGFDLRDFCAVQQVLQTIVTHAGIREVNNLQRKRKQAMKGEDDDDEKNKPRDGGRLRPDV